MSTVVGYAMAVLVMTMALTSILLLLIGGAAAVIGGLALLSALREGGKHEGQKSVWTAKRNAMLAAVPRGEHAGVRGAEAHPGAGCGGAQPPLSAAFTLIELLTVLVIMGIITALTLPAFTHWNAARQQEDAARRVSTILRLARQRAIADRRLVGVLIPPNAAEIAVCHVNRAAGLSLAFAGPIPGQAPTTLGTVGVVTQIAGTAPVVRGVDWAAYGPGRENAADYPADVAAVVFRPTGALVTDATLTLTVADAVRSGAGVVTRSPRVFRLELNPFTGRCEWQK